MSVYYPQGAMTLRILWEDFGESQNTKFQEVYSIPVLARRFTVNINDYTQADTFDAEIDYKEFPFDPRAIRACGVTISVQDMKSIYETNISLKEIKPNKENTIFEGFADEESITFDDTKRVVRLEGRDLTAILIDRKYLESKPIVLSTPLDAVFRLLLSDLKEFNKIKIENRSGGELPTIAKFYPDFNPLSGSKNTKKDETYWEIIQDLVSRAGLIAFMELDKLVISKPRALYDEKQAIQFIYGKNIKDLNFKRKLGRKKNFNIVVRSLAPESKENPVLKAEIPLDATDSWSISIGVPKKQVNIPTINPDGSKGDEKAAPNISFLIPDVYSQDKLIEIGQEIYEELGRQQIEGSFETREMESSDGDKHCFNLLKLRNGTPLKIQIDQGDLNGITKVIDPKATDDRKKKSIENTKKFLINRGYKEQIASVLAETLNNQRLDSPLYTKSVKFTLDAESGFKINVDFINIINLPPRLGGQ